MQQSLSTQHKQQLRSTWEVMYTPENRVQLGVDLFMNFFKAHPEHLQLFRAGKAADNMDDLAKTVQMRAHGLRVAASLNNMIDYLDDHELFAEMLKNMARTHHPRNITKQKFMDFAPTLISTIRDHMGGKLTPKAQEAWSAAYDYIIASVIAEYQVINTEG